MVSLPHWPQIPIWQGRSKLELDTIRTILEALGNPHKKLPPTIHIAGTNGKGSTLAMIRSIFEFASYRVHSYTSPHLIEFNERINLAGENISDHYLFELLETVRIKSEELSITPSFFEGVTIAAFLAFSQVPADLLILETGMGGMFDATNIIENPILTIITSISFDHMQYLGNTLEEIAVQKAGIIKLGIPCVVSYQIDKIYQILIKKCEEMKSPAFVYQYDYVIEQNTTGIIYKSRKFSLNLPIPSLPGKHQYLNASSSIASALLLNNRFKISVENIAQGLRNTKWPGRIEKIEYEKYSHIASENIDIYLDGAHNEAGAYVLSEWMRDNLECTIYLILGMTRNRNIEKFCIHFKDLISQARTVKILSEPSSYNPDVIALAAQKYGINAKSSQSLSEAIEDINDINQNKKAAIILTGSLFFISDFYKLIGSQKN